MPRPPWLRDYLRHFVGALELGTERRALDQTPSRGYLWGGNLSLRVDAALGVGGFDPDRGPRPAVPYDGEEEELQRRLAAAGWEVWYEPGAAVTHLVPAERLTEASFRERFRQRALADVARRARRARALRRLVRSGARYALARARRDAPDAVLARFGLAYGWTLLTAPKPARGAVRRGRCHRG